MIVEEQLPFVFVESPALKNLIMRLTNGAVEPVSRKTLMKQLHERFSAHKKALIERLKAPRYVCTTTDIWSCRAKAFIGFTVHFLNERLQRESYALAFRELQGRHTFDYLGKIIFDVHEEFGLNASKVTHTITDGASNFGKCFREYGSEIHSSSHLADCEEDGNDNDDIEPEDMADTDYDGLNEMDYATMAANDNEIVINTIDLDSIDQSHIDIALPKHMRCFAHILNLLPKDFDTMIRKSAPGKILNTAFGKLRRL